MHKIHTCEGLDDNLKVIEAWIVRKYRNKVLADLRIRVDTLVDDLKRMHGVTVVPQKVYRAKKRILRIIMGSYRYHQTVNVRGNGLAEGDKA